MYAAAGGASLASRRKAKTTSKNEKQKQLASKVVPIVAAKTLQPPQSKQFHNLSPNYQASTLMLSRVERGTLKPPQSTVRRHSSTSSTNNLKEPNQKRMHPSPSMLIEPNQKRIHPSPSMLLDPHPKRMHQSPSMLLEANHRRMHHSPSMLIPLQNHLPKSQSQPKCQPLTPTTLVQNHIPISASFALPQINMPESEPGKENERRCSLVRQCEEAEKCENEPEKNLLIDLRDIGQDGNPLLYSELDKNFYGSLEYPMSEVFLDFFRNVEQDRKSVV